MPAPKQFVNKDGQRLLPLFDGLRHLTEDKYKTFQQNALGLDQGDWKKIRSVMLGKDLKLTEDEMSKLSESAVSSGIYMQNTLHKDIVQDWAKGGFRGNHEPKYMLEVNGVPHHPGLFARMQEKVATLKDDPLFPFLKAATPFDDLNREHKNALYRAKITQDSWHKETHYEIAIVAAQSL